MEAGKITFQYLFILRNPIQSGEWKPPLYLSEGHVPQRQLCPEGSKANNPKVGWRGPSSRWTGSHPTCSRCPQVDQVGATSRTQNQGCPAEETSAL